MQLYLYALIQNGFKIYINNKKNNKMLKTCRRKFHLNVFISSCNGSA